MASSPTVRRCARPSRRSPAGSASQNAPSAYAAAVTYGERTIVWRGPTHCVMNMRRDFMPPSYHVGLLISTLQPLSGVNVRVDGWTTGPLDTPYEMHWE